MRVLVDANVVIDFLMEREPHAEQSSKIIGTANTLVKIVSRNRSCQLR